MMFSSDGGGFFSLFHFRFPTQFHSLQKNGLFSSLRRVTNKKYIFLLNILRSIRCILLH